MTALSLYAARRRQQRALEPTAFGMGQSTLNAPLELAIEVLTGIELQRLRRQVEDFDLVAVARHPGAHLARVVNSQVVEAQ